MTRRGWIAVPGLLLCACAHKVETRHDPVPPMPAVHAAAARHVRNAVDAGDGDFELRSLRQRVAAEPASVEARLALAAAYKDRGYPDLEIEHYRLAVDRFPESAEATLALAKALWRAGSATDASAALTRFCSGHPGAPAELFSWVGILADDEGDIQGAEAWHRAAVERDPARDSLRNNLGYNLLLQGKREEAAAELRRALELNPRSEIARNNLGIALSANPGQAVLQWQSVADPATAHSNMAAILMEQKRYSEAREEILKAFEFSPGHAAARRNWDLLAQLDPEGAHNLRGRSSGWRRVSSALRKALGAPPAQQGHDAPPRPLTAAATK